MNGASISKKLGISWQCPNRESHSCTLRRCPNKRREYRRALHVERKDIDNQKNRERYHTKYKNDPASIEKRTKSWRDYAKRKGKEWIRERGRKYRKTYSELSDATRSRIREASADWQIRNQDWRNEYARQWRRKNDPSVGFRKLINEARKSGSIGELIERLSFAVTRLDEASDGQRGNGSDGERRMQLRERDSQNTEAELRDEETRALAIAAGATVNSKGVEG
jgi:gas vesicle protein